MSSAGCARFSDVMLTCFTRAFSNFRGIGILPMEQFFTLGHCGSKKELQKPLLDVIRSCRNMEQWTDAQELLLAKVI